jgi:hypothetical protein
MLTLGVFIRVAGGVSGSCEACDDGSRGDDDDNGQETFGDPGWRNDWPSFRTGGYVSGSLQVIPICMCAAIKLEL